MDELITSLKSRWPHWSSYCLNGSGVADDDLLEEDMEAALAEMQIYIPVTEATLTDTLTELLFRITKYISFSRIHDDTDFQKGQEPRIISDYIRAIKVLERMQELNYDPTPADDDSQPAIYISGRDRLFDGWFTEG
jgi:aspartyl/asparaginyl-tRNA synthetase